VRRQCLPLHLGRRSVHPWRTSPSLGSEDTQVASPAECEDSPGTSGRPRPGANPNSGPATLSDARPTCQSRAVRSPVGQPALVEGSLRGVHHLARCRQVGPRGPGRRTSSVGAAIKMSSYAPSTQLDVVASYPSAARHSDCHPSKPVRTTAGDGRPAKSGVQQRQRHERRPAPVRDGPRDARR
jgi:hypothetical protein